MSALREETSGLTDLMHVFDHELRTPLTALRGHLELVRDRVGELPLEVAHSVEVMSRAVDRLEATVDGVALLEQAANELRPVG